MRNTGLEEAQAGIKTAGRNINNLRYADDTTLMAESEEELKSLLMNMKEESEKAGLKLNIQKTKKLLGRESLAFQLNYCLHKEENMNLLSLLLLFNMLSRLVITFLPRSKHLLISWLQSPSAVILEPQK